MNIFLVLAFLFCIGSILGWFLELFYRRFFSGGRRTKKWVNPGFCTGPYLPIYGFGLCMLYLIALVERTNLIPSAVWSRVVLFLLMAVCMTVIEYIAGFFCLKHYNVRLWDYRNEWKNFQGIICPKYSFFWAVLGAFYYFLIHPHILDALDWLSRNLAFSFVVGMFFGIFIVDAANSMQLIDKLKKFAKENQVVLEYETIKTNIRNHYIKNQQKYHFFRPFRTERPLNEYLKEHLKEFREDLKEDLEELEERLKEKVQRK